MSSSFKKSIEDTAKPLSLLELIYVYESLCPNRCEPSIEVIMKMGVQWGCRVFLGGWGQDGCERRREVTVKIQTKKIGEREWCQVRVDVN